MAVVFISPKQRQKVFLMGIAGLLVVFLIVVSFGVFVYKPKITPAKVAFNKPKININMSVFDLAQFKVLQPLPEMEIQFSYKAIQRNKTQMEGFVSATSLAAAQKILSDAGLTVTELKEVQIGRDNPFIPYFQQTTTKK